MPLIDEQVKTAQADSVKESTAAVARYLVEVLGISLTAYMLKVTTRTVGNWANDAQDPRYQHEGRLRNSYYILQLLAQSNSDHTVRAWMIGMNPQLGDEAPAEMIREGNIRDVLVAAKAFLSGG